MDSFFFTNNDPIITLKNGESRCQISPFGAHISSWVVDGEERLWTSSLSPTDGSTPVCGGIPISFPRPQDSNGDMKLRDFVRGELWEIYSYTETRVVFRLRDTDDSYELWPYRFLLENTVELLDRDLRLNLKIFNTGGLSSAFSFTGGLPAYLRFPNTERVVLLGFKNTKYVDKVDGARQKIQKGPVNMQTEALRTSNDANMEGYVDRDYLNSPRELEFHDLVKRRPLFRIKQSTSWRDTSLYNPWLGDKQGQEDPEFDDDGFLYMICVQPAVTKAGAAVVRPGDGGWNGSLTITVPERKRHHLQ